MAGFSYSYIYNSTHTCDIKRVLEDYDPLSYTLTSRYRFQDYADDLNCSELLPTAGLIDSFYRDNDITPTIISIDLDIRLVVVALSVCPLFYCAAALLYSNDLK